MKYFIIYGRAIFLPIPVQLDRNLQKMFLGDVSTTSTNIYFVQGLLNTIIFSFQVHVTEFILFTLFFGDISPIYTNRRAIFSPISVQMV